MSVARFGVEAGMMTLPVPPPGKEFRMVFWKAAAPEQWGVLQHCVPWRHEAVAAAAVKQAVPQNVVEILPVASRRWLVFDRSGWSDRTLATLQLVPSQPPELAVLAATHAHRRGV